MAEKKPVYIRCPRCELNYCLKKDKYCSVCKAEMEGDKEALIDDLELELCPICKTYYIQPDEIMCANCLKERKESGETDTIDEEWDAYVNREDNDDIVSDDEETGDMASISEIDDDVLGADIDDDLVLGIDVLDTDDEDIKGLDDEEETTEHDEDDDFEDIDDEYDDLDEDDIDLEDEDIDDDDDYRPAKSRKK